MKNFFKKLAFVLALAMIVTAIAPAAKASAATEPSFKYKAKVLYLGGDKTGNYGDTYRFKFNNAKGYKATWKSSKKSVATVDAKTGEIQALAVGKTTITATLKKGKNVVECKASVTVKQNAEKIGFGSLKAVKNMAVGDTAKVNVYRQVGDTKVWKQADKTVCTDVVKWTTSDASVATVDKWGKVTAVAAGEATITATATQSEGSKAVVFKSFKVTVAAGLTDAKQATLDSIAATFAGDLSATVTKENVKVYKIVGDSKINVIVKEVKFDDADKSKATITVYTKFDKDAEYVVEYNDTKASFKGADASAEAVTSIAIKTTEVKPGEATKIEFKVFDKNGVEITSTELTNRITVKLVGTNPDCFVDESAKTIVFWAKDKSATVKASFNTYTYNTDFTPKTIDVEGVIVSKENVQTLKGVGTATIAKANPDFTKPVTNMSVKDADYRIFIKTVDNNDKEIKSEGNADFKFESTDEKTLMVVGDLLKPVKEGTAQILVKYKDVLVGAVTVTIGAERKPATVTATFDRATLSKGVATDVIKLNIEVKDQYNAPINSKNAEITFLTGAAPMADKGSHALDSDGKVTVRFTGDDYAKEGSYQYKVKVGDIERYVSFTVGDAKNTVSNYKLSNPNHNVDTALKIDGGETADKKFEVGLYSIASNGYKVGDVTTFDSYANAFATVNTSATSGSAFYYEVIDKDGKVVDFSTNQFIKVATSSETGKNAVVVSPVVASGSTLVKLPTGTYQVKAVKVDTSKCSFDGVLADNDSKIVKTTVAITSFVVTDTQAAPSSVDIKKTEGVGSVANFLGNPDYIEIKFNGNRVALAEGKVITAGTHHNIETVKVTHTVNYAGAAATSFVQEITINALITE